MILSHAQRFIFVKTTKTASSSIEVELARYCGPDDILTPLTPPVDGHAPRNTAAIVERIRSTPEVNLPPWMMARLDDERAAHMFPHLQARAIRALFPDEWSEYLTFCVERNPWDKVVSGYYDRRRRGEDLTFEEWVPKSAAVLSGARHWSDGEDVIVDRILRFENLGDELRSVLAELGLEHSGHIEARAKTGWRTDAAPYREYYTEETRAQVGMLQRRVVEELGYVF